MASKLYVFLFALVIAVQAANAFKCYKCDSKENMKCSYGFTSFLYDTTDCSEFLGKCYKVVAKSKDGAETIVRGCLPAGGMACNAIVKTIGVFDGFADGDIENLDCYTCDGDKCNSSQRVTGFSLLGLLVAAFVFLF